MVGIARQFCISDAQRGRGTGGGADCRASLGMTCGFSQTTTSYHGGDAAQSGAISNNGQSWMQTTVSGPAIIRFRDASHRRHSAGLGVYAAAVPCEWACLGRSSVASARRASLPADPMPGNDPCKQCGRVATDCGSRRTGCSSADSRSSQPLGLGTGRRPCGRST